uniref:uncharacterized protein LOC109966680 n=1 Tax=Monopterus albus TaxID=43700 RepID=UPI0009B33747|nr:uncharacterized protein LOC109966680 [Monopterus albus]
MGYLCILTGHRSVALTNMTKESVASCVSWNRGKKYQVLVDEHKTSRSFSQAAFILNREEIGWLRNLSEGTCCMEGRSSRYVFHTVQGKQMEKPSISLRLAWRDSGMQGGISFNQIRSSVSTQASQHLTEKERKQVAKSMCHDPSTAERFYVALPDKETSYRTRKLRMKALRMASAKPSQEDKTSSDEQEAPSAGTSRCYVKLARLSQPTAEYYLNTLNSVL